MTIMSDKWIKRMVKEKQMIKPFEKSQIRKQGISYGVCGSSRRRKPGGNCR